MNKLRVIFAGTPEFAANILADLCRSQHEICAVYTQPDRPAGRGRKLTASAVKQLALEKHIPVFQPPDLKSDQEQALIAQHQADVMVVVAYGLILPQIVLDAPAYGCINVHASLLPHWRGAAPIQRAIENGDAQSGVTIMQMDAGLDTGAMMNKRSTDICSSDTAQSLHDRLAKLGSDALLEVLNNIEQFRAQAQEQDESLASYAKKLNKSESPVNWDQSAALLHRKIQAFNPWPVATTTLAGKVLRLWLAETVDKKSKEAPGTVIEHTVHGIDVATGAGVLRITSAQWPGGKPLSARDIYNAHRLQGELLGH